MSSAPMSVLVVLLLATRLDPLEVLLVLLLCVITPAVLSFLIHLGSDPVSQEGSAALPPVDEPGA